MPTSQQSPPLREYHHVTREEFERKIIPLGEPAVFRGLVEAWPVVCAARQSPDELSRYLRRFDRGRPVGAMLGPPRIQGRFFYSEDLQGFNFKREQVKVSAALDFLLSVRMEANPPAFAVQSVPVWDNLTGFDGENPMPLLEYAVEPRMWIGNAVTVAAHFDPSENVACVVAGRRRFTLFPPGQVANLYVGPFERTPAGTTISMVDFDEPDLVRHPRFAAAMASARIADLEAGDAIYIPYLWWHHVRSLEPLNLLVNYWWKPQAPTTSHPMDALLHAILTVRDLPPPHRAAWRELFEHYAFLANGDPGAHLPQGQKGVLGSLDEEKAAALRKAIAGGLSRR